MNRWHLAVGVGLFFLVGAPAYAYGDPSGGTLFQVLMPALAALWATWMIFASRVRSALASLYRKLRGAIPPEPTD
jgi:hypothetical protein